MTNRLKPHILRLIQNVEEPLREAELHKELEARPASITHLKRGINEITEHAEKRLGGILRTSFEYNRVPTHRVRELFEKTFISVVKAEYKRIIELGKKRAQLGNVEKIQEQIKKEKAALKEGIREESKKLVELKWATKRALEGYKLAHNKHQEMTMRLERADLHRIAAQFSAGQERFKKYPAIPRTKIYATAEAEHVPAESGIYFIWDEEVVWYVGQSVNLNSRLRLSHEKIQEDPTRMLSWVLVPRGQLMFAECYYIALCEPYRNRNTPSVSRKKTDQRGQRCREDDRTSTNG